MGVFIVFLCMLAIIVWLIYGAFFIGSDWHGKLKDKSIKGVINYWLLASIDMRNLESNSPIRVVPFPDGVGRRFIYCDGRSIFIKSGENGYRVYDGDRGFNVGVDISSAWYLRQVVLQAKRQVELNKRQEEESKGKEMSKVVEEMKNADKSR